MICSNARYAIFLLKDYVWIQCVIVIFFYWAKSDKYLFYL